MGANWFFLVLLIIVSVCILLFFFYISNRVRRIRKDVRSLRENIINVVPEVDAIVRRQVDRSFWPQVESLITLYRLIDRQPTLPSTRRWAASPDFILHLFHHIQRHRPRIVVECGGGTSTVAMAYALAGNENAHIYCIENHPRFAAELELELKEKGLSGRVTVIVAPLTERRYPDFPTAFHWYDLSAVSLPTEIDMLVVDGPFGMLNEFARYPAGPELLPRLSARAHIFIDDAGRPDEASLGRLWRALYPDLGVRELRAEKGATEMFFLDEKIKDFMPVDDALRFEADRG